MALREEEATKSADGVLQREEEEEEDAVGRCRTFLELMNEWRWFEAVGVRTPSFYERVAIYVFVCFVLLSEWFVVAGILIGKDLPSTTWMVTLTNIAGIPMAFYAFYMVIIKGTRPDLVVEGCFALLMSNSSLWYHFCDVPAEMGYCMTKECSEDCVQEPCCTEVFDWGRYDRLMHWDFAAAYFMFSLGVLVWADLRCMIVKLPVYGAAFYICWDAMRDWDTRGVRTGNDEIKIGMAGAILFVLVHWARSIHSVRSKMMLAAASQSCEKDQNAIAPSSNVALEYVRALREVIRCIPFAILFVAVSCFVSGLLFNFEWTDHGSPRGDSGYTTPHGFWHICIQGSALFVLWCAVKLNHRLESWAPPSASVEANCTSTKLSTLDLCESGQDTEMELTSTRVSVSKSSEE